MYNLPVYSIQVLPYFKKSEKNLNIEQVSTKYHGFSGEQDVSYLHYYDDPSLMFVEAGHERGLPIADANGPNQTSIKNAQIITDSAMRVSTNNAFIQPIRYERKNLVVKVESEVFKVLINKRKIAYGVKYYSKKRIYTAYASKEVIICAGVVNSPKLLMQSGVGPRKHLRDLNIPVIQDLKVGENLHDHPSFNGILIVLNKTSTLVNNDEILEEVLNYKNMTVKSGLLTTHGPFSVQAFIKTDPELQAPDIQISVGNARLKEFMSDVALADSTAILPTPYYDALTVRVQNLVPKSRGKILLNATNPYSDPLIYANYLKESEDVSRLLKAFRWVFTLEDTNAFKKRGAYFDMTPLRPCTGHKWGTDDYLTCMARAFTSTTHHQVGTCKMGPISDETAVVDAKLRVYGISRLRVIDCSIMPVVNRGNTNAPSIMIGERGVEFILSRWKESFC